jgi:hypothetical protein
LGLAAANLALIIWGKLSQRLQSLFNRYRQVVAVDGGCPAQLRFLFTQYETKTTYINYAYLFVHQHEVSSPFPGVGNGWENIIKWGKERGAFAYNRRKPKQTGLY